MYHFLLLTIQCGVFLLFDVLSDNIDSGTAAKHQSDVSCMQTYLERQPPDAADFVCVGCGCENNADMVGAINMIQGQDMPSSPEHFPKSAPRFSDKKCDKTKN